MSAEIEQRVAQLEELVWLAFGRTGAAGGVLTVGATAPLTSTGGLHPVIAITPGAQSDVPVWDGGGGGAYSIRQLTADDIAAGFSITSFTGGSTVEVGASVVNPAFAAAYSSLPLSAQITNTDGTDSPHVLVTPFTAGTVLGTFHKTAQATVSFTLTAVGGATKTATQAIAFLPRDFGGVGTAGAVSATAAGNTAVLNGGLGTLANQGLSANPVGSSFGPFSPVGQKIYLMFPHTAGAHTFKDGGGFTFAMNAPTVISFTNQNGAVLSMDLYESTNVLSSPFTITVVT